MISLLINSLADLRLNQAVRKQCPINSLGTFICASEIKTIEHERIIFVENLAVMADLSLLNIPEPLKNALWLYRGDQQSHKNTGTANQFFKQFKNSHTLVCFSDLDPQGIQIAQESGATHWLTITDKNDLNIKLKGVENEWFNQKTAISYLNNQQLTPHQQIIFNDMKKTQKTLKQEHMIAHSLRLDLFEI